MLQFISFILFCTFIYLLHLSLSDLILASNLEGIDNPLSRWVQVFVCLCRCNYWGLVCSSYWIDTLVLTEGNILFCTLPPPSPGSPWRRQDKGYNAGVRGCLILYNHHQKLICDWWHVSFAIMWNVRCLSRPQGVCSHFKKKKIDFRVYSVGRSFISLEDMINLHSVTEFFSWLLGSHLQATKKR